VVNVTSLWANESAYWPVNFEPYTPAHHFEGGKQDPNFRTKLKIARELVELSVEEGIPFTAVVADWFYGEDEDFKRSLERHGVGYVLALKPSHAWWRKIGEIGSPWEAALAASEAWNSTWDPGDWLRSCVPLETGTRRETDTRRGGGLWRWMWDPTIPKEPAER
jgi:hypothetical protein